MGFAPRATETKVLKVTKAEMALCLLLCESLLGHSEAHRRNWADAASETYNELQSRYWSSSGYWRDSMWWQEANTIEAVSNLAMITPADKPRVEAVLEAVYNATTNNTVARCNQGVNLTFSGYFDDEAWWGLGWLRAHTLTQQERYLLRAQAIFDDLVNRSWSEHSCGGGCCWQARGIDGNTEDMAHCYKNAITNELFISLGAQLSATYKGRGEPSSSAWAHGWAQKGLRWFVASGMINSSSLVNDGLDTFPSHPGICLNNRRTAYTYNQGVILSALGYLYATAAGGGPLFYSTARTTMDGPPTSSHAASLPSSSSSSSSSVETRGSTQEASAALDQLADSPHALLQLAARIINAVWAPNSTLTYRGSGGVLREVNEASLGPQGTLPDLYSGSPGTDGLQFKSVLIRHLRYLIDQVRLAHGGSEAAAQKAVVAAGGNLSLWREHIVRNAESIWDTAACAAPQPLTPGSTQLKVPALFGFLWTGPCAWAFGGPTATTQTAALDVFVAAAGL